MKMNRLFAFALALLLALPMAITAGGEAVERAEPIEETSAAAAAHTHSYVIHTITTEFMGHAPSSKDCPTHGSDHKAWGTKMYGEYYKTCKTCTYVGQPYSTTWIEGPYFCPNGR